MKRMETINMLPNIAQLQRLQKYILIWKEKKHNEFMGIIHRSINRKYGSIGSDCIGGV